MADHTKFMDKELKELVVTLPFADGSEMACGIYASFDVDGHTYFALLPYLEDKTLDFSKSYMLYRVEYDADNNPVVMYIEDDFEYAAAARYFAEHYLDQ